MMKNKKYVEFRDLCYEANSKGEEIIAHITFTEDSFLDYYTDEQRTYVVSSNNKLFKGDSNGFSFYGSCLDGSDRGIRLDMYMRDIYGGENGWAIEKIAIKEIRNEIRF